MPQILTDNTISHAKELKPCNNVMWVYHNHSDLLYQIGMLFLHTVVVVDHLTDSIPAKIVISSNKLFECTGLVSLNLQYRVLLKNLSDFANAVREGNYSPMVATATRVVTKAFDIFTTCALPLASLASLCGGNSSGIHTLINVLCPIDLSSSLLLTIRDLFENNMILSILDTTDVDIKDPSFQNRVIRQIGVLTFEKIHGSFSSKQQMKKALDMRQTSIISLLGLKAIGYLAQGLYINYPNTLLSSGTLWSISALATAKVVWEKWTRSKIKEKNE
ncbi:MAG: hypothetical protein WB791_11025 [Waddliaceae bacterium]